ncbi:hypothetical protein [Spiroplasma endosymbiont of Polydrusus pterygomalis]|uniref:hypothetical protein n=1 Tax=Spiroplasma endosymbiont of Polydrusus pterygomalis TaxID=3139327 RepID=UPI003CCAB544
MKKILSFLVTISLMGTSTTSLVACDKSDNNGNSKNNEPKEPKIKHEEPPGNSNWKLILNYYSEFSDLSLNKININNMWYIASIKKDDNTYYLKKFKNDHKNITGNHWNNAIAINHEWFNVPAFYKWKLKTEPIWLPKINNITGKIIDWKN